ncbi:MULTISPECIES: hypothetical protein [Acetobacter]
MSDLKYLWRLVQVMNEIKAWRFVTLVLVALAFAVAKALPGLAAIVQACQ